MVDLNRFKPRTVLVDVPFSFDNKATRATTADNHYRTMNLEELKSYSFPHDQESCLLLFWSTNATIPESLSIIESWRFQYKGMITWIKPHMGLGNYARNASEQLIVAVKGKVKVKDHSILTWFISETREHSRKPEQQYDIAERLGFPPYLELFARRKRNGWESIGDQING